jgi:hypothetical protein
VEQATLYGNKYVIVTYAGNRKGYLHRLDDVSVVAETKLKQTPVFRYFLAVAQARGGQGGGPRRIRTVSPITYCASSTSCQPIRIAPCRPIAVARIAVVNSAVH